MPAGLVSSKRGAHPRRLLRYFIFHFRPPTVAEKSLRLTLTWGLGGMAALLVIVQIATGVLLKFAYDPVPSLAYASILHLRQDILFGTLVRNLHYWSANLLVLIIFLHLLRVFFTGGFLPPRRFNWVIGLCLLVLVLGSNFTGYLLPWDQLAYWGTTICIGMLGYVPGVGGWLQRMVRDGAEIGPRTLQVFFAMHTAVLPILIVLLMTYHFWRVRKAGGVVVPRVLGDEADPRPARVPAVPDLLLREGVVALVLLAFLLLVSVFLDAPLGEAANPGLSPNPTKAPWYFAGIQEMLMHLHPSVGILLLPVVLVATGILLPYVTYEDPSPGVWFVSRNGRRTAWVAVACSLFLTVSVILLDEYVLGRDPTIPGLPAIVTNGLIPAVLSMVVVVVFYRVMVGLLSASRLEAVQSVFVLLVTTLVVFTVTCVCFRGPGMRLVWPF